MTIKFRLGAAFATVVLLLIGVAVYAIMSLSGLNDTLANVINGPAKQLQYAMQVNVEQAEQSRAQRNALLRATDQETEADYRNAEQRTKNLQAAIAAGLPNASEVGRQCGWSCRSRQKPLVL